MEPPARPPRAGIAATPAGAGADAQPPVAHTPRRRKNHRGGKKKKARRKSFALQPDDIAQDPLNSESLADESQNFYSRRNLSNTSLDSEALLDHREQQPFLRPRRPSMLTSGTSYQPQYTTPQTASRFRNVMGGINGDDDDEPHSPTWNENAPLLPGSVHHRAETFGGYGINDAARRSGPVSRRNSSRGSSRSRKRIAPFTNSSEGYNVNYPPSVPGTPPLRASGAEMSMGDLMMDGDLDPGRRTPGRLGDADGRGVPSLERRHTVALDAETDVCFPQEGLSELGDDDLGIRATERLRTRRRRGKWPDLTVLDEWSRFEKEGRSEGRRAKKITEPQLINGRLRAVRKGWFQAEEDAPYRFTYFNEEFESTIHSQTISELVQPGGTFKELFIPDPPLLSDSSDDEEEAEHHVGLHQVLAGQPGEPLVPGQQLPTIAPMQSYFEPRKESSHNSSGDVAITSSNSRHSTPRNVKSPEPSGSPGVGKPTRPPKYGDRPVWWLDILSPSDAEMKVLSKAFGIHPLTAEDIMVQEQREKVELFRHYYFVNYRSFDQDETSENFLEPVNMYVVVFREGVLSFHFSVTPHPANVRRRIRQLNDYMVISSDWISYAIIDDITDVFGPLIQNIEDEVDDIDDAILQLHSGDVDEKVAWKGDGDKSDAGETSSADAGRNMLRRVGDCRKRVMSLYRLLGNKADVIKGFAKRCNEHWEVAPRSEIGLYLGDIQDHIVTMTSNLSHYEKILARSHANYLAQINIRMNERQEQTADVLGKLTVLGTIVLPMNIITGLWGMNVWVPGQGAEEDLRWFVVITAGLLFFGLGCYLIAKRVYNIV
ncbi:hypothetical protein OQA88_1644 [Cercophora sp. LCS_1]